MTKINKHIEIVVSSLKNYNSMSLSSSINLKNTLRNHYSVVDISVVDNKKDLLKLIDKKPDVVFKGMKCFPVTNSKKTKELLWITNQLEDSGITVTGSNTAAIKLDRSKNKAKDALMAAGVATSPYFLLTQDADIDELEPTISFPMFLKPHNLGGGAGIDDNSVVHNRAELKTQAESLFEQGIQTIMAEQYLPGREFTVAVLRDASQDELLLMPFEIVPQENAKGQRVQTSQAKAEDQEQVIEIDSKTLRDDVIRLAKESFIALGARDYGRIDIRLDKDGVPNFLEGNLVPSMMEHYGNFPKACQTTLGMDYEDTVLHIVDLALGRRRKEKTLA